MNKANKNRLEIVNSIITEYQQAGYVLTLRQLYYQLVSRDIIPNVQKEYNKLSILLKEGRMAGIVDWDAIEDRLRKPYSPASFENPKDILKAAINQYQLPRQEGQNTYLEVWVEKDALSGVLKRVTEQYHVPILVNRGYSSASAIFDSFQRLKKSYMYQKLRIFYLGDYDPSGIDMIRDATNRIMEFAEGDPEVDLNYFDFSILPIALTINQIKQYNPPPNPVKKSDTRAKNFIEKHGNTSWEVDALKPEILNQLLDDAINENIDIEIFKYILSREKKDVKKLKSLMPYLS